MKKKLLISENRTPSYNLAVDEYLVRHMSEMDTIIMHLYINDPCIVMGKNQNIFREVNYRYWQHSRYSVERRISGGGTVIHDLGNLNVSIIEPKTFEKVNQYDSSVGLVAQWLNSRHIATYQNQRRAIFMTENDRKISGCAQFTSRDYMLSHLTLLVESDIDQIEKILTPNPYEITTKASKSVPSNIGNLNQVSELTVAECIEGLSKYWGADEILELSSADLEHIKQLQKNQYQSNYWKYQKSSQCKLKAQTLEVECTEDTILCNGDQYADEQWMEGLKKLYDGLFDFDQKSIGS